MRGGRLGGGATVLSDPDDDAMGVARVQEGLLPVRIGQVDPDGLHARRLYQGQRVLDVGDEEAEVVRARAAASQEAVEKAAPEPRVGVSSSIFGPVANFSWPHQYPGELPPQAQVPPRAPPISSQPSERAGVPMAR